jgi:hypothetical protein
VYWLSPYSSQHSTPLVHPRALLHFASISASSSWHFNFLSSELTALGAWAPHPPSQTVSDLWVTCSEQSNPAVAPQGDPHSTALHSLALLQSKSVGNKLLVCTCSPGCKLRKGVPNIKSFGNCCYLHARELPGDTVCGFFSIMSVAFNWFHPAIFVPCWSGMMIWDGGTLGPKWRPRPGLAHVRCFVHSRYSFGNHGL